MNATGIGQRIAALRRSRGMTQRHLAELLGVTDKTISRWEREDTEPDLKAIIQLAAAFEISTDTLLTGAAPASSRHDNKSPAHSKTTDTIITILGTGAAVIFGLIIEPGIRKGDLAKIQFDWIGWLLAAAAFLSVIILRMTNLLPLPKNRSDTLNEPIDEAVNTIIHLLTILAGLASILLSNKLTEVLFPAALFSSWAYALLTALKWYLLHPLLEKKGLYHTPAPLKELQQNTGYTACACSS